MADTEKTAKSDSSASQADAEQNQSKKTRIEIFWEIFKDVPQRYSAFFAGCAFVVSCVACLFSYCQMRNSAKSATAAERSSNSAEHSIKIAEQSMRISNRPYMIVNGVPPINFENWNKIVVTIKTKNFGKTPAMRTKILAQINCFPNDFVANFPLDRSIDTVKTSVDIGTEMPLHIDLKNHRQFTKEEIAQLNKEQLFLFAYGIIEYTDIFSDSLRTRFNFKWNGKKFEVHQKYNDIK